MLSVRADYVLGMDTQTPTGKLMLTVLGGSLNLNAK
jgi:hypothetical protein